MDINNLIARIILFPFSLLYGAGVAFRNMMYDSGLLRSTKFNLPVISVGNLSVGGAGKTPHVEYLVMLLKEYLKVSVLSRGYKRKTKGFRLLKVQDTVLETGDEPLQYKRKWPDLTVSVCESRNIGIPLMLQAVPDLQCILLDDAFQHRGVTPGLNILLTTYNDPYSRDYLLPAGRLREYRSAAERADIIIVTKCPKELTHAEMESMRKELMPLERQKLFFSSYRYGTPYFMYNNGIKKELKSFSKVILLSAIANEEYLVDYVDDHAEVVHVMKYEDHHFFTEHEVSLLKDAIDHLESPDVAIITTEKDAMRLDLHRNYIASKNLPIFVLPVRVNFQGETGEKFDELVKDFMIEFKV